MRKKSMLCLLLCLCLMLSACQRQGQAEAIAPTDREAELTLTLYATEVSYDLERYLSAFHKKFPHVEVETTVFSYGDIEQFDERLTNEINAGAGPDILLFPATTGLDVRKMARNGAFVPLGSYLDNPEDPISSDNYMEGTFEAGKVGDEVYFLPLTANFTIQTYSREKQTVFAQAPIVSFAEFMEDFRQEYEACREGGQGAVMRFHEALVAQMLEGSQVLRFSEDGSSMTYDEEELKAFVDAMAAYRKQQEELVVPVFSKYGETIQSEVKYIKYAVYGPLNFVGGTGLACAINQTCNDNEAQAFILRYGDWVPVSVGEYGAVNRNAGEKAGYAYEFLRAAMELSSASRAATPLNKWTTYEWIAAGANSYWKEYLGEDLIVVNGLSEALQADMREIIDSVNCVVIPNMRMEEIFMECFEPYFDGSRAYEPCVADFDQRINLYLTE